ncbi:MAG: tetratricopeptide repeat protein, partial [Bacteroidetes bacterium]|nr:tetratricopeptide repeat protein [Bacteroidota bacterium]
MRNFIFFFFLFFLLPAISIGQQTKIDSLLSFVKNAPDDTVKVNASNALSREYRAVSNAGAALHYAQLSKELAERIQLPDEKERGWSKGIANSLGNMGIICFNQGNFKKAFEYHTQALKIREKIEDKIGIGNSYNNLGINYSNLGNIEKAFECHLKSLKMMEEIGFKSGMGNSYTNIGLLYSDQENYDEALKYLYKSLEIGEQLNDKLFISICYNNIGLQYENQGKLASSNTMANDKYQKALTSHLKSLKIGDEIGNKRGTG